MSPCLLHTYSLQQLVCLNVCCVILYRHTQRAALGVTCVAQAGTVGWQRVGRVRTGGWRGADTGGWLALANSQRSQQQSKQQKTQL